MIVNILMCEIGHAMGLNYTSEENNLMYSTGFNELIIIQQDILFWKIWKIVPWTKIIIARVKNWV